MWFPMCKCQIDESVWYLDGYMTIEIHQTLKLIQKSINYHENFSFSAHVNVILKNIEIDKKESLTFDLRWFLSFEIDK